MESGLHARTDWQNAVVPMRQLQEVLIADARAALERALQALRGREDLLEAFSDWLAGQRPGAAGQASRRTGAQRTYSDVAMLGYAADAGGLDQTGMVALRSGLEWISGRPAFVDGAPTGLGTDGVAALGIALGARAVSSPHVEKVSEWFGPVANAAHGSGIAVWHRLLFAIAGRAIDVVAGSKASLLDGPADLRLAMSARGLFQYDSIATEEADALSVIEAAKAEDLSQLSPAESAIRLAALNWIVRVGPVALPGRVTTDQVAALLRRVPTALRLWTWEARARTRGGTARRWEIDHEYHVQNLLWTILAPLLPDLREEESTPSVAQKHPRADLCVPSLRLIIEVKFLRAAVPFSNIVEEVAADAALYFAAGSPYEAMLVFLWDDSRRVEEHDVFIRGVRQIPRIADVVVVPRPGSMA